LGELKIPYFARNYPQQQQCTGALHLQQEMEPGNEVFDIKNLIMFPKTLVEHVIQ
jgi:hypothetical protein